MEALGGFGERRFAKESLSSKLCMKPFKVRPTGDFIVLECHISSLDYQRLIHQLG